jgi:pilus assembly protein Flp/PilA
LAQSSRDHKLFYQVLPQHKFTDSLTTPGLFDAMQLYPGSAMHRFWQRLLRDSSGASAMEYGVIIAMVSLGMVLAVTRFGNSMQGIYLSVNNATSNALTSP